MRTKDNKGRKRAGTDRDLATDWQQNLGEPYSWIDLLAGAHQPAVVDLDEVAVTCLRDGAEFYHQRPIRADLVALERRLNAAALSLRHLLPWVYLWTSIELWEREWSRPVPRGRRLQAARRRELDALALLICSSNVTDRLRPALAAELARLRELAQPRDGRQRLVPGLTPGFRRVKATSRAGAPIEWPTIVGRAYHHLRVKNVPGSLELLATLLGLLFPSAFPPADAGLLKDRVRALVKSAKPKGP
jgi:hypothetical protein